MFEVGKVYNRRQDIHSVYGGQQQGGISTPDKQNFVLIFTSKTGSQHGYKDGWSEEGYLYTGEGQTGDMTFSRGNLAILNHEKNNKALYLFEYVSLGHVQYLGEMRYATHNIVKGVDSDGNTRKVIVFVLKKVN